MTSAETTPVTVSDRAAKKIASILGKEPEGAMLRVAVEGGGCSGFQYQFDIVREREDDERQNDETIQSTVMLGHWFLPIHDCASMTRVIGSDVDRDTAKDARSEV